MSPGFCPGLLVGDGAYFCVGGQAQLPELSLTCAQCLIQVPERSHVMRLAVGLHAHHESLLVLDPIHSWVRRSGLVAGLQSTSGRSQVLSGVQQRIAILVVDRDSDERCLRGIVRALAVSMHQSVKVELVSATAAISLREAGTCSTLGCFVRTLVGVAADVPIGLDEPVASAGPRILATDGGVAIATTIERRNREGSISQAPEHGWGWRTAPTRVGGGGDGSGSFPRPTQVRWGGGGP